MDSFNNDIVVRFASYLCSRDLVNLSLTCRKFGSSNGDGLSSMEDTARQIICNAKQEERDALPRMADQSYIELYSELEQYRAPRIFDQLIGGDKPYLLNNKFEISQGLQYVKNDKSHIKLFYYEDGSRSATAICNHRMRAGKHYVTLTMGGAGTKDFGIIRPIKNWNKEGLYSFDPLLYVYHHELQQQRTERWGGSSVHYCATMAPSADWNGGCYWSGWEGKEGSNDFHDWLGLGFHDPNGGFSYADSELDSLEPDDKIGMLLDLDFGTLAVYKNGRRLGIMKDGLSGEYCWVVKMARHDDSVRIEKGPIPIDV